MGMEMCVWAVPYNLEMLILQIKWVISIELRLALSALMQATPFPQTHQ
jgi:hypothetical protein